MKHRALVIGLATVAASFQPSLVPICAAQSRENPHEIDEVVVTAAAPEPRFGGFGGGFGTYTPSPWEGGGGTEGFVPNYGDLENVPDAAEKPCDQRGNPVACRPATRSNRWSILRQLARCRYRSFAPTTGAGRIAVCLA